MSRQLALRVLFSPSQKTHDARMNMYGNEDYVAHFDDVHPTRRLTARWPFAIIGRYWQARAEARHQQRAVDRLVATSAHLLDDLGLNHDGKVIEADTVSAPHHPALKPQTPAAGLPPAVARDDASPDSLVVTSHGKPALAENSATGTDLLPA